MFIEANLNNEEEATFPDPQKAVPLICTFQHFQRTQKAELKMGRFSFTTVLRVSGVVTVR
jgi:hypothetical protein